MYSLEGPLKKNACPLMPFIEIFCITCSKALHEFFNASFSCLLENEMVVIRIQAKTHETNQFLFGFVFFFSVAKKIFVYTADRIECIKFVHTAKKSLLIQMIAENFPFVHSTIENMIILTFSQLCFSHT